jgi:type II secretory pathway pseudopilin PulG
MQRARRADAKTALEQLRAAQEMYRAEKGSYSINLIELVTTWGVPNISGDYAILLTNTSATNYTGEALPTTARQLSDGSLFINQDGRKWDSDGSVWPQGKWAKWFVRQIRNQNESKIDNLSCFFCLSFRDLEVYQNTYKACIEVMTKIIPEIPDFEKNDLKSQLRRSVKAIPRLIGSAPEGEDVLCLCPEELCEQ